MTDDLFAPWSGALLDMPSCNCLCAALHPKRCVCDPGAPRAMVTMAVAGSLLAEFSNAEDHTSLMCLPCAEVVCANHPRARGMVALVAAEDGKP